MADNTTRIADIDEIIRAGIKTVVNDGTTITHDFDVLAKERRRLIETDNTLGPQRRPRSFSCDLSSF